MGMINKPDIIKQSIVINDDYIRKNRRADGKIGLSLGYADTNNKRIIINNFNIDKNATLLSDADIEDIKQRISSVDEGAVVAHEAQHIHNSAVGYHYLANSDNIYECIMLSLADEMSAMLSGYLQQHKNLDDALADVFKNLSGTVRKKYMSGQFMNHFKRLESVHGKNKNLYEHNFDTKKINRVLKYYFSIDGTDVMDTMSMESKLKYSQFMVDVKSDIKKHIDNQIIMSKNNQKDYAN